MSAFEQVKADVAASSRAKDIFSEGMDEFQAACIVDEWDRSECARAKIKDAVDAYCDSLAAAHKVIRRS